MATRHAHINPSLEVMEAMTRGVELGNRGNELRLAGRFEESEQAYAQSLAIKQKAFPEDSVHICITLSGLADTLYEWAKATKSPERLRQARLYAERMLAIATRIKSPEQRRVANEIIADITKEEGKGRPERDIPADTDTPAVIIGGGSISVEPPTARCGYMPCSATRSDGVDLKLCARCKRVYYCGRPCQTEDWAQHKKVCTKL
jgi:hypothetical protein